MSVMGALMFVTKLALSVLPNIHLNALFVILGGCFFGARVFFMIGVYILLEGAVFGFGLWWLSYLYIWPILGAAVLLCGNSRSSLVWAVIAALHGLFFGALCAIPYLFLGGAKAAFAYWISGIPFDLAHCAGNFTVTLILYRPLYGVLEKLLARSGT